MASAVVRPPSPLSSLSLRLPVSQSAMFLRARRGCPAPPEMGSKVGRTSASFAKAKFTLVIERRRWGVRLCTHCVSAGSCHFLSSLWHMYSILTHARFRIHCSSAIYSNGKRRRVLVPVQSRAGWKPFQLSRASRGSGGYRSVSQPPRFEGPVDWQPTPFPPLVC